MVQILLMTNNYREYAVLAEYEFAPIDRLGLEIETDFSFYAKTNSQSQIPENKLDKLILSVQYSFFVSPKYQTTMAIGYAHEFELTDFSSYDSAKFVTGMVYKPFFVAAKKWGESFHTLIFTGPIMSHNFNETYTSVDWQINTSLHYNIPNTHHFIGVEFNKEVVDSEFKMTMRPQLKLQLNEAFAVGLVAGFPIDNQEEKFSSFFRLIYEL